MRMRPLVFSLSLALPAIAGADQPLHYLEEDGIVAFEVEQDEIADGWTLDTAVEGYTGTGFLEWTGPDRFHTDLAGDGTMSYRFRITTPGNYEVRWRSRIVRGEESTEHNDSWLRLPTGEDVPEEHPLRNWFKVYMNRPNSWSWDTHTVDHEPRKVRRFYDVGDHVLEISGRSAGHAIDRVVLYRYEDVDFDASRFQRLPPSETTGEPFVGETDGGTDAGTGGGADGGSDDGGDTSGEGSADGATGGGDESADGGSDDAGSTEGTSTYPVTDVSEHPPGECLDDRLVLAPLDDAHVGEETIQGGDSLRIDGGARRALIAYDLDALPSPDAAELQFTVDDDDGRGTLRAYLASHTDWQAGDGNERAPDSIVELGNATGNWTAGTRYAIQLDPLLLPTNVAAGTLVLELDIGGEDIALASSEVSGSAPLLLIEGDASFCTDYDLAREADGANAGDTNSGDGDDAGVDVGNTDADGEADTGGGSDGDSSSAGADAGSTDAGGGADTGGGSGSGGQAGANTDAGELVSEESTGAGTDGGEGSDGEGGSTSAPVAVAKTSSGGGASGWVALFVLLGAIGQRARLSQRDA